MSEDGLLLRAKGDAPVHVPAYPVRVGDVCGAGDTVGAVLGVMLGAKADFESAVRAAKAAAAVVVGKRGTATVGPSELRARLLRSATLAAEEKIARDSRDVNMRPEPRGASVHRDGCTKGTVG